ncbi:hypothetical protein C2R22_02750 [Salinigranum rubrum]|uniref:Iron-binding zinc finger CDGSH type domain-containing protein n=1 Tax=Salinigranum rubrum TaxID=755307 RepID=A0A2I8VI34_9EURY|nr:hypothetical protein C2R22_02750 [Salinigranum rubrum]
MLDNTDAVERRTATALCRSGASADKPFCDGTHVSVGFENGDGV